MARISGAIVALVMAVLLGFTIYAGLQPDKTVLPTNGVMNGARDDVPVGEAAARSLGDRAQLQRWRAATGPSPREPAANPTISGTPMPSAEPSDDPRGTVEQWLSRYDTDWYILNESRYLDGTASLPAKFANVLEQPQGRTWRRRHSEAITFGGGDVIFGMTLLLGLFLAFRGRIRLVEGESGETVERFSAFERANHWVTATSFIIMALTGLVILYGQYLIKPWLGPDPYGGLAAASAYVHIAFAIPFVAGIAIMIVLWLRQNWFNRVDWQWLKRGGGFISEKQESPSAERFNAGQKLIFWAVVLSSIVLLGTGLALTFPLLWLDVVGMQWAQAIHAAVALVMVAVIIGHIYIGTVGMQGAFQAMWSGLVDRNWAREHHRIWYDRVMSGKLKEETREPRFARPQRRQANS